MHWVVSETRSDNALDRVSGGIGDADGATLGAVAAGRLLLGGLMAWMACRMARWALVAPCRGGLPFIGTTSLCSEVRCGNWRHVVQYGIENDY